MPLRNNNIGLFGNTSGGGGGGSCCGVLSLGLCQGVGISISVNPTNPITNSGTFYVCNTLPYFGESVEVLGSGQCSTFRCKVNNLSSGCYSAGLGGTNNCVSTPYSTIVGGISNKICANTSISESKSFIGGGCKNITSSSYSTIVGGLCNNIRYNAIGKNSGLGTTILGGYCHNTFGGSFCNAGIFSFIGGGCCNKMSGNLNNALSGCYGVIFGGGQNCVCGCLGTIGGGFLNLISGSSSMIYGGNGNCITLGCSVISGTNNKLCRGFSSLLGGNNNTICSTSLGSAEMMFGGANNIICENFRNNFLSGGLNNTLCSFLSSINGGITNINCGNSSSILNGQNNIIKAVENSVVINGILNTINSNFSIISGCTNVLSGTNNTILNGNTININSCYSSSYSGYYNLICTSTSSDCFNDVNGINNCIFSQGLSYNSILNGNQNCIVSDQATCWGLIGNGFTNSITTSSAYNSLSNTILNGDHNCIANDNYSFIGSGSCNTLIHSDNGIGSVIVGGYGNNTQDGLFDFTSLNWINNPNFNNTSCFIFIGGGQQNNVLNCFSSIVGGFCNRTSNCYSFIGGGICNSIQISATSSAFTSIGGGSGNIMFFGSYNSSCSFIGGGFSNWIYDKENVIIGGCENKISFNDFDQFNGNSDSFIGGGSLNCVNDKCSVILGGNQNCVVLGDSSVIFGGKSNQIGSTISTSECSVIGGGIGNKLCGNNFNSSILGGQYNCTNSDSYNVHIIGSNITSTPYTNTTYVENLNITQTPTDCTSNPSGVSILSRGQDGQVGIVNDGLTSFGIINQAQLTNCSGLFFCNCCISGSAASGVICLNLGKGTSGDYLAGDASTRPIPNVSSGGGVVYYMNGSILVVSSTPNWYQFSNDAIVGGSGTNFTLNGNGILSRFVTPSNLPNLTIVPNGIWFVSTFLSISTNSALVSASIYSYDGSTFTLINTGTSVTVNNTTPTLYTMSIPFSVVGTYPSTTRFAIELNVSSSASGRITTHYTEDNTLGAVSTTFPSGLGSFNSLICPTQVFQTTCDGNNFNIVSNTCSHCFNLPTASATKCGALSTSDWSRFNGCLSSQYQCNSVRINKAITSGVSSFYPYCVCCGIFEQTPNRAIIWGGTGLTSSPGDPLLAYDNGYAWYRYGNMVYLCYYAAYNCQGSYLNAGGTQCVQIILPTTLPLACLSSVSNQNGFVNSVNGGFIVQGLGGSKGIPSWCTVAAGGLNNCIQWCGVVNPALPTCNDSIRAGLTCCNNVASPFFGQYIQWTGGNTAVINCVQYPDYISGWVIYMTRTP